MLMLKRTLLSTVCIPMMPPCPVKLSISLTVSTGLLPSDLMISATSLVRDRLMNTVWQSADSSCD